MEDKQSQRNLQKEPQTYIFKVWVGHLCLGIP